MPGGVNSPVRAFNAVGGHPVVFQSGKGATLIDADGNPYIDYVGSYGPLILGHSHPAVLQAVHTAIDQGLSFGAPSQLELTLAQKICHLVPYIEKVRMVNSGTEACMTAIRLARGYTQRNKIIKFSGCYHGHSDALLTEAGSGVITLDLPGTPGIPADTAKDTLIATFNCIESVNAHFNTHKDDIAAVIIEPIAGNMNLIPAEPHFLQALRDLCNRHNSLLIFDEVMTGFRVALGGAQSIYQITPDLVTLGKIIGGGMPVGALGGASAIMNHLAPCGPIYQAGTLSGNPISMAAGIATLDQIAQPGFYPQLSSITKQLVDGIESTAHAHQCVVKTRHFGGMFGLFFGAETPVHNYADAKATDSTLFRHFFHYMLKNGIYFAPSPFEAGFVSIAHTPTDIQTTLAVAACAFKSWRDHR